MLQKTIDFTDKAATVLQDKTGIPKWGIVAIFILIALIILGICGFCIRRCFRKRRSKDSKKGMKGVDLKSVQLLGSAYKEKVNIIMSMNVWLSIYSNYI
jgi:synaptotagmin-1